MSNFPEQLEKIKALLSSNTNKSFAYSTLSYLQEQCSNSPASIQALVQITPSLVPLIIADVRDPDEEISVQALKCLGFTMYHPSVISALSVEGANMVLESLAMLITTTKIKSVCNLGIWCISVQQFSEPILVNHFKSLLGAIVHGLDNPFGSLSTTFEAIQAVIKLAGQLGEKMRDLSYIWTPPIYRRLVSLDKREREISERCILKIRSLVVPPPLKLSKALVKDMRRTLLTAMNDLLNRGMKVQTIRAWGWFINFLGPYAMKNRNLINDMLKIPEHTFSSNDPQLQIASQVAWEGLIDALIHSEEDLCSNKLVINERENAEQANGFTKSLKLIMTPLIGIMSSKCDALVHASCFNTWYYLLHKLDSSINFTVVKKLVLKPMFEAVFRNGFNNKSISLWSQCIDLLDDSIIGSSSNGNYSWKQYDIKWLPWESSHLEFHLNFIQILIDQASEASLSHEERSSIHNDSLRLFRSVSKGVQMKLKQTSTTYDDIMSCLNTMLKFIKDLWEEHSIDSDGVDFSQICLMIIEIVSEEIEPSVLDSPLYKVALALEHIEIPSVDDETIRPKTLEMRSINYKDMVSPMIYLNALYLGIMASSKLNTQNSGFLHNAVEKYLTIIFSSYEPLDNFMVAIGLLYKRRVQNHLRIWIEIAKFLKKGVIGTEKVLLFKSETGYYATCDLLCYPLIVLFSHQKDLVLDSVHRDSKVEFEEVVEQWKSLYDALCALQFEGFATNKFPDDLSFILDKCLESSHESLDLDHISVYGGVVISVLENSKFWLLRQDQKNTFSNKSDMLVGVKNCLSFAIRFMRLLQNENGNDTPANLDVASRLCTALVHFISHLHLKKLDIRPFLEIISSPLLQWLPQTETQDETTNPHFQLVWIETLNCLLKSEPPLVFNNSLLEFQSPILEKTLSHPNPAISGPTISFWNATYGNQPKLIYPQNLLHVLDKLSRNGRINLQKRRPFLNGAKQGNAKNPEQKGVPSLNMKRKRLELTEHQKEVRRAQRGRGWDCMGHGLGGIRTYTSLDFSQGNEDSQESQEVWNLESCNLNSK